MKAIICTKYGPPEVLQLREVEKPNPKDDEVLIKIDATAVTASDIFIRSSNVPFFVLIPMRLMLGICKPRKSIIGLVLAGEIESIGKDIKRFKVGNQVYGLTGFGLGAYAEYKCMKETDSMYGCLALKPTNISYEEATVAAYGGLLAVQFMEKGTIQRGQNVLIYGASGSVGTYAVQLAKYFGANVIGVCSTANLALVKSLGADTVIDYIKQDFTATGEKYDFIFDAVGKLPKSHQQKALAPNGTFLSVMGNGTEPETIEDLMFLSELLTEGKIKPVIDEVLPLQQAAQGLKLIENREVFGKVVICP